MKQQKKPVTVKVVAKTLRILEVIAGAASGLTLKPISQTAGVNKTTAYRLLTHLERDNYLVRTPAGAYRLGPKWWELARAAGPTEQAPTAPGQEESAKAAAGS